MYHLGNNKGVHELMKTDYDLEQVSHLGNVLITDAIIKMYSS